MLFREWSYCFFLLVCKTMAFGVSEIIQNLTLHPRDEERQSKIIARDKPCLLQFNTFFWEVVLLFFFLLVCEILSPVCPPKIFFKNLHIDIQCFIQHKYRLRGQINILHRKVSGDYQRLAMIRKLLKMSDFCFFLYSRRLSSVSIFYHFFPPHFHPGVKRRSGKISRLLDFVNLKRTATKWYEIGEKKYTPGRLQPRRN